MVLLQLILPENEMIVIYRAKKIRSRGRGSVVFNSRRADIHQMQLCDALLRKHSRLHEFRGDWRYKAKFINKARA